LNNPILNDSSEHDADCGGIDCYDAPRQTTDSWWAQAISYVSMTFYPILSKLAFVTSAVTPVSSYAHEEKQYIENYKPLGVEDYLNLDTGNIGWQSIQIDSTEFEIETSDYTPISPPNLLDYKWSGPGIPGYLIMDRIQSYVLNVDRCLNLLTINNDPSNKCRSYHLDQPLLSSIVYLHHKNLRRG